MEIPITNKQSVGLYYYNFNNFGDLLNELIMDHLHVPYHYEDFPTADLMCIGSLMERLIPGGKIGHTYEKGQQSALRDKPIHIWGTGLMFQYQGQIEHPVRPLVIHALRGEHTQSQLSKAVGNQIDCVLADPGLLASFIIKKEEPLYDVGLIPHYHDKELPIFREMQKAYRNAVIIDVQNDPSSVLKKISQCRTVFSSSLHGIIVADSYNIPNCWCIASNHPWIGEDKFHDYFSSYGKDRDGVYLQDGTIPDPDKVCKRSFRFYHAVKRKQKALLKSFPFLLET